MRFLESSVHERALLRSAQSGVVPLKYAYAGSAATTHMRLARTTGYQGTNWLVDQELDMLLECTTGRLFLYEFGPGDGMHSCALLQGLVSRRQVTGYCGIDFARTLLQHAYARLKQTLPVNQIDLQCADLEQPFSINLHPQDEQTKSAFLMLGGLLGNVENPLEVLKNIRNAIPVDGLLMLSVTAIQPSSKSADYLAPYQTSEFEAAAVEPLLALGVPREWVSFRVAWNQDAQEVQGHAELKQDWQQGGHGTTLCAHVPIRVFTSRRFSLGGFRQLVESSGLFVVRERDERGRLQLIVRK